MRAYVLRTAARSPRIHASSAPVSATHLLQAEGVSVIRIRTGLVVLIGLTRRLERRVLEVVGTLYAVAVFAEDRPDGGAVVVAVQRAEAASTMRQHQSTAVVKTRQNETQRAASDLFT